MRAEGLDGLYVHVPFCPTICPYCDFHVVRRFAGAVEAYLERLEGEARALYQSYPAPPQTLYFGGGTPSFLRSGELERLLTSLPWSVQNAEVTMEANPGTLNQERLGLLKSLGINRLSIGVQSFQDSVLRSLGRAHGRRGAFEAVELALNAGVRTSIDLILGLPGQDFERDLLEASALGVGHVSAYTLQVEPGTPFEARNVRLDEDVEATAFERAEEILGEAGFIRYEVSNFAKPGQESRHNLTYWNMGFWGALGPSAAGHRLNPDFETGGHKPFSFRYTNPPLPRWLEGEPAQVEEVSVLEYFKEALMMGLRTGGPVYLRDIEAATGHSIRHGAFQQTVLEMEHQKLIYTGSGTLGLWGGQPTGMLNNIILRLWDALDPIPLTS